MDNLGSLIGFLVFFGGAALIAAIYVLTIDYANKRIALRFSLRTMLIGVTLLCVVFAWVGYSRNWIEARRLALQGNRIAIRPAVYFPVIAPGGLWLLGESGVCIIRLAPDSPSEFDRIVSLFPEANVEAVSAAEFDQFTLSVTHPRQLLRLTEIGISH